MVETIVNKKRIARNTIYLYIRMLLVMGVMLYTQRVVLDKLGASDYGIYHAVGGVVAMLGFLNSTLSTGTSRFLTYELGRRNIERLKNIFSTAFFTHLILAVVISVFLLTAGIWFVKHELVIPSERLSAAEFVLVISVLTTLVSIIQVPYTSIIIAHENMSIYAYIGLFEAFINLGIAYLLSIASFDRLILYSILIAALKISIAGMYMVYCLRHYSESHLARIFDRGILKDMISFSSWNLVANLSQMLGTQGLTVILNMFFSPVVIAAQAIGNQISLGVIQFRSNFSTAVNPQIIKLYSIGHYSESRKLTLETSILIFELMLLISLPIIVFMDAILNIWLVEVPKYAVVFSQYMLVAQLLGTYNTTLYIPMVASGKLKDNSYASIVITVIGILVLYIIFKMGGDILWVQYIALIQILIHSLIVKPLILCRSIPDYKLKYIFRNLLQLIKISLIPVSVSIFVYVISPVSSIGYIILYMLIIMLSVCISSLLFMEKETRTKLLSMIKIRIR